MIVLLQLLRKDGLSFFDADSVIVGLMLIFQKEEVCVKLGSALDRQFVSSCVSFEVSAVVQITLEDLRTSLDPMP